MQVIVINTITCFLILLTMAGSTKIYNINLNLNQFSFIDVNIYSALLPKPCAYTLSLSYIGTDSQGNSILVNFFTESLNLTKRIQKYSVWNYQNTLQIINIQVSSTPDINFTQNIIVIGQIQTISLFTAVFDQFTSNNHMLPFNLLNQKYLELFAISYNSEPVANNYNMQTYMSTYWTQLMQSSSIFPFLPYFSQCSYQREHILINDLIQSKCYLDDNQQIQCDQKNLFFQCIIQQLEVTNIDTQFWFNKLSSIVFYLFPKKLTISQISNYKGQAKSVNSLVQYLFTDLIPVYYTRQSTDNKTVNDFYITFSVYVDKNQIQIVSASIVGMYNQELSSTKNGYVHVHTNYLTFIQRFNVFNLSFYWYIFYGLAFNSIIALIILFIHTKVKNINISDKIKIILAPAFKGMIYAIITSGIFFIVLNQITYQTSFSNITAQYGDVYIDEQLQMNNIGRNCLVIVYIGLYLLNVGIKQVFKVSSSQELKIAFEDDNKFDKKQLNEQQLAVKIQFTKKNMNSHKRYILISSLFMIFLVLIILEHTNYYSTFTISMIILLLLPILSKLLIEFQKLYLIKQMIYLSGNILSFLLINNLYLFTNTSVYQFTYMYLCRFLNLYVFQFALDLFFQYCARKIDANSQQNRFAKLMYKIFKRAIELKKCQSQYQKSLYYGSIIAIQLLSILMMPFVFLCITLAQRNKILFTNLLVYQHSLSNTIIIMILMIPAEIYAIFVTIQVLKKYFGIRIEEVIKFNKFKFKRRKFRWMNDEFSHNKNIRFFYRQLQKFCYSSQLYFIVTTLGFSAFLICFGSKLILLSGYQFYGDPIVILLLMVVWISGNVMSIMVSFAVVKLKMYEKKEQEMMRQNLIKIDKYLKISDISQYLELDGVKDYFLLYNKDWIINNLNQIFDKQDFEENNGELINKYKHYKSIFKKKEIEEKRRQKIIQQNQDFKSDYNSSIDNRILISKGQFNLRTKPIMYYWYYLAKQNLYLKSIVSRVKKQKMKDVCQYCNMSVQLEALEKKQFQQLVNQYRILNVNRLFDEKAFLQYYRINQQYITICVQCKDKNLHLETKIMSLGLPSKIVMRWHMIAKSNLIHKPKKQ